MIVDLQSGVVLPAAAVAKFIRDCDRRGWAEAAIAGLYLNVIRNERAPVETQLDAIAALLDRAIDDGEQSMAALALARRARVMTNSGDPASRVEASRELARAAVLLETATGDSPFRARAHVNCAIAFGQRDEWELEDEHYIAAENVLAGARAPSRLGWSILYNRAEVQLNWTVRCGNSETPRRPSAAPYSPPPQSGRPRPRRCRRAGRWTCAPSRA